MIGDGSADGARGDAVARADDGVVGEVALRGGREAVGQEVRGGVAAEGAPDERSEHAVGRRVADQDPAEQRLRVVAEHELLVHARHRVGVGDVEGVRRLGERVAEARDLDAGELEFGGGVEAVEGGLAPEQPSGGDLGHRVAGGDQADALTAETRDLADREDRGVGGAAAGVDDHAAPRIDAKPGGAGQLVAGADADREDDDVDGLPRAVAELQSAHGSGHVGIHAGRHRGGAHVDTPRLDQALQRLGPAEIELRRHQTLVRLEDEGGDALSLQGSRGLEPEQTPTDHRAA